MTKSLMSDFQSLCENVYGTIFAVDGQQNSTVQQKLHGFVSALSLTSGLIQGKTVLPLPSSIPASSTSVLNDPGIKDHIHDIEEYVVTWSRQIRAVLAQQPESVHDWDAFPEPKAEIDFWTRKAADLESIQSQLSGPDVSACIDFLEKFNSQYPGPFKKLIHDVQGTTEEAQENAKFVSTLTPLVSKLSSESLDFENQIEALFEPILHYILLIWKHSRFYKGPSRLVIIIRLVCNSIIRQCQRYVNGQEIFSLINNDETNQALSKLNRVLQVCTTFQEKYELFKGISEQQGSVSVGGWRVQNRAVFEIFDEFRDRVKDIHNFLKTVIQYFRMEKIEIGGTRGTTLTNDLQRIVTSEFRSHVLAKFQAVEYDILQLDNVSRQKFDTDYFEFKRKVREMDKRICFIIGTALNDLNHVSLGIRLIDSFDGVWDRPLFAEEFEKSFKKLSDWYRSDLKKIHALFLEQRSLVVAGATADANSPPLFSPLGLTLPPISRAIYWARTLSGRANEPLTKLESFTKNFPASVQVVDEFRNEIVKFNQSLNSTLDEFVEQIYVLWETECVEKLPVKLGQTLLIRQQSGELELNFHPFIFSSVIREVKYIEWFGFTVPARCKQVYERRAFLRKFCGEIRDKIVSKYNKVIGGLLEVERPLLHDRLVAIDKLLSPGFSEIDWTDENLIQEYVGKVATAIGDVAKIYEVLRETMRKIGAVLDKWSVIPVLEKRNKPVTIEEFDSLHKASVGARMVQIADDAKEIYKWIREANEAVRISRQSVYWRSYLEFLNVVVSEGFTRVVDQNMTAVVKQLEGGNHKEDTSPILEITLRLDFDDEGKIVWDPPFRCEESDPSLSIWSVISNLIGDSFSVSSWMTRFPLSATTASSGAAGGEDFVCEVSNGRDDLRGYVSVLGDLMEQTEERCESVRSLFDKYEYLLDAMADTDEPAVGLGLDFPTFVDSQNGLKWADIMSMVGIDCGRVRMIDVGEVAKKLEDLASMRTEISNLKGTVDIDWVRVNSVSVKHELIELIGVKERQSIDLLQSKLDELVSLVEKFMNRVSSGFGKSVDGVEESLYTIMTDIKDVRLSSEAIRLIVEPIKEIIGLLKRLGQPVTDGSLLFVEHFNNRWDGIIKTALNEREKILPFQNREMEKIKGRISEFMNHVSSYRAEFVGGNPFDASLSVDEAMDTINSFESRTTDVLLRAKELNNLELLFDLTVSKYPDLHQCVEESLLLRHIWGEVSEITGKFAEWEAIHWDEMDADELIIGVRDIGNRLKSQIPKEIKSWGVYTNLTATVKNMSAVLPLISDLHTDTMRDRHWRSLMDLVGTSFVHSGPQFCLGVLLKLQLHRFADDVCEIVNQSAKEFKIEKKLGMMRNHWEKTVVALDVTSREDKLAVLPNLGEIIEVLENHSLEMLGIVSAGGKYIEFCKALVDEWVGKLRTIDSVLAIWQKVQRNWMRLEPIFLCSEDIRAQLPEDTRRFEQVDKEWRDLMNAVVLNGNSVGVVEMCCQRGERLESLERMHMAIEQCEKSLNDYLEEKRKIFPRFYFVSNQALLDILSNGNRPRKVAQYLGDCFDGIKTLDFVKDDEAGRRVSGMYSKDGEYVGFHDQLVLDGPVEQYLLKLESHMRNQLRGILESAKNTADNWDIDKPREIWLRDYCAQLALVATQIVWTEEVTRAFEELESGSETAMKEYKKICDDRIEKLIRQVQQPLSADLRNKIITIITIDVHARDVVEKFVQLKLNEASAFQWQSQLKFSWGALPENGSKLVSWTPADQKTCLIKICDWSSVYGYEYIGNCGRLVITPLTDRCYLTLTQALNLAMGAAPSGPAGTGKTETTKDLSRAIGLPIVVFNCSDQMTYMTMANVIRGLSSMGAWGCFDEFNRISLEVLSVVSTQVKSVLDAIKEDAEKFLFMDEECKLVKTVGFFITMNPGYAGRNVLPESLSSQFRSCAMVVPDLTFICENMLLSEGFLKSRQLARKFVCLYSLCKELLSAQMHYDWGLRAVKSLLRQAGSLKRADPDMDEYSILMRALRDFNTPKIVSEDLPIFLRLISDLFPGISADPKNSVDMEQIVIRVTKERGLQADKQFVTKVIGLLDILRVRHCCFIIGPPGSGKTTVWKVLMDSLKAMGEDGQYETLNPKAITSDELYGIMTKTKEWKDGAISVIMRNMSKEINGYKSSHKHKWIVLDGDIDARWIESMNTVMDDNKVLTLVSNERIPFTPSMRMLLEVQDMVHASPATVSRGGVLFINEYDIGCKPFLESWRESKFPDNQIAQSTFFLLFNQYFETHIEYIRKNFAFICSINDMGFVQSICSFIDALLLTKESVDASRKFQSVDQSKLLYESFFVYAFMWSVGGAVAEDKSINHRRNFSNWFRSITTCKFPEGGEVFDYRFDPSSMTWVHWEQSVRAYVPPSSLGKDGGVLYQKIIVPNTDIERLKFNLHLNMSVGKPVLFCGIAGTGKTTIVRDYLATGLNQDTSISASINLNSYTDSFSLQKLLEGHLDKRTGRTFGPPGNKKCVYFIDDLNMPLVDEYDTQSAAMLLFQLMSHKSIFDRAKLDERKEIVDVQFVSCMNPKAGSFMVNSRLQRHYTVQSTYSPSAEMIGQIFGQVLGSHLSRFESISANLSSSLIQGTVDILNSVCSSPQFLPSGRKFHYQFNLKEVSNIVQGLLNTSPAVYRGGSNGSLGLARVWIHECSRVFSDRLVDKADGKEMDKLMRESVRKNLPSFAVDDVVAKDLIMTSFVSVHGGNDKQYVQIKDMPSLRKILEEKLVEYNETFPEMNLVLFDDAIEHVCRVARIVDTPCGHALLVGVGGSGKQSLARLACFIVGVDVLTIQVNQGYGVNEFKTDLQEFIRKAAVKPGTPQALLVTDGQIVDERFLVYINDILSEGLVPGLFAKDEIDGLINGIRTAAKSVGVPDDRDALYEYLKDKVRKNLHVIICHSPVGETLRVRARKFPALVANTTVDVFQPWPRDALYNVANRFLFKQASNEPDLFGSEDSTVLIEKLSNAMADIHISIDDANLKYLAMEGRYNYTTPKSFLELLSFYNSLLRSRRIENQSNIERLEKGLNIMAEVGEKVSKLQEDLSVKMIEVEEKKQAANGLISEVTAASEVAAAEKAIADEEAAKTNVLAQQASEIKAKADAELEEAMPAMQAAKEAVNCLTKPAIQELKSLGKPPVECTEVTKAVLILLKNERKNLDWKSAQKMMNNPQQFLDEVVAFNADSIPDWVLDMLSPILSKPFFNYETMKGKSTAAAYLTNWVVNIIGYNRIYKKVAPLMARVKEATAAKETAESQLAVVMARVAEIEAKVASLQTTLNAAVEEKDQVEREAARCESKLSLAKRLVGGLSDENSRWSKTVDFLRVKGKSLVSDLLIAAAFVVYISPFNSRIREDLWQKIWSPFRQLVAGSSSAVVGEDPLNILASEADIATWRNEGLPADRMSIENASIITSCDRWPLLIDPQLQGLNWLKKRIPDLVVIQLNQPNWLQKLCTCIQNGGMVLIESIGQEIDPLLDPLLSRSIIRRGRSAFVIRLGGEEIEYDMKFRMFLQCKLSNPHFKPEIAAQCTIVNFIVTPDGLEDQILAMVVNVERPELEQEKVALVRKQNEFKVTLAQLEDDLLSQLSRADPATILDSTSLVEGLETTKRTAVDIAQQVESAKKTETEINTMREKYRPVAQEGSMLFFMIIKLASIEHMYQYSLDSFVGFLFRAIARTPSFSQVEERVINLVLSVRMTIFKWVNRGLFEKHKLVLCGMLAFKLLQRGGFIKNEQFNRRYVEFLLGGSFGKNDSTNPLSDWLPNEYWRNVQSLIELPGFELFAQNMEKDAPARFKDWFVDQTPEDSKLPLDWKRLDGNMLKLLILKCLRPDRLSAGLASWITHAVPRGSEFVNCDSSLSFFDVLESSFVDADQNTPIFFILSPGADPIKDVEKLAKKMSSASAQINIHVVAMGQGQDVVAMSKLDQAHKDGDWIVLQNIHLMPKWCMELERKLDQFVVESSGNPGFRIFLSADPSVGIPIGILDRSIKLTNEPPQGMVPNMKRAFASFSREVFEEKDSKVKQILMGLCHFHSVMLERKKFGPLGYNMNYPFSIGDLRDSALILFNTLENGNSTKIPWDDIKFLFGEIMYGGHIVDDWDRRLCKAYLDFYMTDDLVEGDMNMVPYGISGTAIVRNPAIGGPYDGFLDYIETVVENPVVFGLHPNAEIGFRTSQSSSILGMLNRLVDRPSATDTESRDTDNSVSVLSGPEKARKLATDILEEIGGIKYSVEEVSKGLTDEERGPYQYVFLQECECMNTLVRVMVKSLSELQLGLKGELTISEQMEQLMDCLIYEQIPPRWAKVSFASNRPLLSWLVNLKERCAQLDEWISDPSSIPKVVDLSKLFNPQSFLNAIKQTACQRQNCELDKLQVITEVTKKTDKSQVDSHSRDGAFVTGLYLEGARWDLNNNCLEESRSKEMFCKMPIINCKAGVLDENSAANIKSTYICPTYCTVKRRPNFVFSAQLRTPKHPPSKWTLAGVALILDIGQ